MPLPLAHYVLFYIADFRRTKRRHLQIQKGPVRVGPDGFARRGPGDALRAERTQDGCMIKGTFHFDAAFRAPVRNLIESIEEEKRCHLCRRHLTFAVRTGPRCWNWGKHDHFLSPDVASVREATACLERSNGGQRKRPVYAIRPAFSRQGALGCREMPATHWSNLIMELEHLSVGDST